MNLNLQIIKADLSVSVVSARIIDNRLTRKLEYPTIYSGEKYPLASLLYLAQAEDIPADLNCANRPSFLCIGEPSKTVLNSNCNILVMQEGIALSSLLIEVIKLFHKYNTWELELQKAIAKNLPLRTLGKLSEPIFKNPVMLFDSKFKCIFFVVDNKLKQKLSYFQKDDTYMDMDEINAIKHDKGFINAAKIREPVKYESSLYKYPSLYINIFFSGNEYFARLLVDEVSYHFTDREFALIEVLANIIKIGLQRKDALNIGRPKDLDEIIQKLLKRELVPEEKISNVLSELGWHTNDHFFCLIVEPSEYDITNHALTPLSSQLSATLLSDCYVVYKKRIIFVVNLTKTNTTRDHVFQHILPKLRDSILKAAISKEFSDFKELYYYFQQGQIALDLGKRHAPTYWFYRFEDFTLDYIIEQSIAVLPPKALCPAGLLSLINYDQRNQTDYTNTLRVYLESGMSAIKTQKELFMHRNTLSYRLKRILEILNMDLEDSDVRIILLISFKALTYQKKERESQNALKQMFTSK